MIRAVQKIDQGLAKISLGLLIVALVSMVLLTMLNCILRFKGLTSSWIISFQGHLVLLSVFLGGILAIGEREHFGVQSLLDFFKAQGFQKIYKALMIAMLLASLFGSLFLFSASYDFFKMESEFGKNSLWGIHSRFLVMMIPIGFALISFRFWVLILHRMFSEERKIK